MYLLDQTRILRSTGHVARVGEEIKYNGVVSRPEGKRMCGRTKRRRKINVTQKALND
jgi:hypothetical protein